MLLALCDGNPPVIDGFPSQRVRNAKSLSMSWRHHTFVRVQWCLLMSFSPMHCLSTHILKDIIPIQLKRLRFKSSYAFFEWSLEIQLNTRPVGFTHHYPCKSYLQSILMKLDHITKFLVIKLPVNNFNCILLIEDEYICRQSNHHCFR